MALTTKPYFGLTGGWLTFWVSLACTTDMTLFGYDQEGNQGGAVYFICICFCEAEKNRDYEERHELARSGEGMRPRRPKRSITVMAMQEKIK